LLRLSVGIRDSSCWSLAFLMRCYEVRDLSIGHLSETRVMRTEGLPLLRQRHLAKVWITRHLCNLIVGHLFLGRIFLQHSLCCQATSSWEVCLPLRALF